MIMTLKVHEQNLQLIYSLKLGDGCFVSQSSKTKNYYGTDLPGYHDRE